MGAGASTNRNYDGKTLRENLVKHYECKVLKDGTIENNIEDIYDFSKGALGEGVTGVVHVATRKSDGAQFAIKKILLEAGMESNRWYKSAKSNDPLVEATLSEIKLLAETDHPNICRVYETYHQVNEAFYLVMELCKGGELFDRLLSRKTGHLTEREGAYLASQMFESIRYLHAKGIAHRDLKLENFIFADKPAEGEESKQQSDNTSNTLKLIDFGFSKKMQKNEFFRDTVGTSYYIAPEVLAMSSTKSSDLWSLGVITYMLLSGNPPFSGNDDEQIMRRVAKGTYRFDQPVWQKVSKDAIDFIKRLMVIDPTKRMTAAEAFKHPWLAKEFSKHPNEPLHKDCFKQMQQFANFNQMKKIAIETIAFSMTPEQIRGLTTQFEGLDADHDGYVTIVELKNALLKQGHMKADEVNALKIFMAALDETADGKIELSEFVASSVRAKDYQNDKALKKAFHQLDTDGNGYINKTDLKRILGQTYDKKKTAQFMEEVDENTDGKIDYGEFMQMMKASEVEVEKRRAASILPNAVKQDEEAKAE